MPNNDTLWLRKIAAFLHDPPYKVWYFGKTYKGQKWKRDKDVIEIYEAHIASNYPFKAPHNPAKIKFRKFHHVGGSAAKNNYFGLKGSNIIFDARGYRFIHPLSGETTSLKDFWDTPPDPMIDPKAQVENFLQSLIGNEKQKFLNLWRLLSSKVTVWINLLPVDTVLADNFTRDLDVIQSALITAWDDSISLERKESLKPSFLILEFGPVQKFIANARKTRDLWFSSWLISYLAWQAMKPIAGSLGPDNIVYSDLYKQPLVDKWLESLGVLKPEDWDKNKLRMPSLPNTFLAIVQEGKEKHWASEAIRGLKSAWKELVDGVCNLLTKNGLLNDEIAKHFDKQTEKFPFNIYWLGLKWGHDPEKAIEDYKKFIEPNKCWEFERLWSQIKTKVKNPNIGDTYALLIEMAQTGLKALKYRGKPKVTNEPGHKCSLCGERTALTDGDPNDLRGIKTFWKRIFDAFPGHIKGNEHLCAVCLVKRLAPLVIYNNPEKFFERKDIKFDYHYPSTGSIALAPFVKRLFDKDIDISPFKNAIRSILKDAQDAKKFLDAHFTEGRTVPAIRKRLIPNFAGDFEPEWFYDESFSRFYEELEHKKRQRFISENEYGQQLQCTKEIERAVSKIKKAAKDKLKDDYHLPKYYAAVYLDGDNLGKWLRGEFAPKIEDVFHPDFVKHISNDSNFMSIKNLKRPVTPAIHRAISGALRDFALEVVPYVVEENLGVVVYSGGDDTLFLMPLENLFKTLVALRMLYSGEKFILETEERKFESDKGFIKVYDKNGNLFEIIRVMGTKATLSAGVAISHYLDPLDITITKAKEMLEKAKDVGRNRAGFKVILHSGSEREAIVPWNFVETMDRFKGALADGFSSRFLRTLYRDIDVFNELSDAFDAEFYKFGIRGQANKDYAKSLLCNLLNTRKAVNLKPKVFLDALLISEFLVREEKAK